MRRLTLAVLVLPTTSHYSNMTDEYIRVREAFKLVAETFIGDKRKLKEFCESAEAAFG